jgi:hypothetical protein
MNVMLFDLVAGARRAFTSSGFLPKDQQGFVPHPASFVILDSPYTQR